MNTLVLFEVGLVISCLIALILMRRTYFPMNLFWAVGVVTVGVAAALGALVYSGFSDLKTYHNQVSLFAGSIGIACFALAAVGGVFARQFHEAGWWVVLTAIIALIGVLLFDSWQLPEAGRYGVVGILAIAALYRLIVQSSSGLFIVIGVVFLVAAGLASGWVADLASMQRLNVYHTLLSLSVLSFGAFAAKE
ncbi:MAG: hypothetical protein ABJN40_07165 [Sneathiella sp.]